MSLVYKLHDNASAPAAETAPDSGGDGFSQLQLDTMGDVIAELRREWRAEIAAAVNDLRTEFRQEIERGRDIAMLQAKVDLLLERGIGGATKTLDAMEIVRKLKVAQ